MDVGQSNFPAENGPQFPDDREVAPKTTETAE